MTRPIRMLDLSLAPRANVHIRPPSTAATIWTYAGPGLLVILGYLISVLVLA